MLSCLISVGGHENMTRRFTETTRFRRHHPYFLLALTLRLIMFLSLLRLGVADKSPAGVRQLQYHDAASRTIQADLVLLGRVDRVMRDPAQVMVVRVLTVYKGHRRLRRRATSVNSSELRLAVDLSTLGDDAFSVDNDDVDVRRMTSLTSLTPGTHLILFLRQRDTDATLTHYVTSGGRRRRRNVDLYRMVTSPATVTESVRKAIETYSKRRNGKFISTSGWSV